MPFFDDNGIDEDALRSPIWGTFSLVKNNIEVLVALNVIWSVALLPIIAGVAAWNWPAWLRLALFLLGLIALGAATGVLFGLASVVCQQEPLSLERVREAVRAYALDGLQRLAPLYGIFGLGLIVISLAGKTHFVLLEVPVQLVLLWLLIAALYWGPLFVAYPGHSPWFLLKRSLLLVWRYPAPTTRTGLVVLALIMLGIISLAGVFLIIPALIAILQTFRYRELAVRSERSRHKFALP